MRAVGQDMGAGRRPLKSRGGDRIEAGQNPVHTDSVLMRRASRHIPAGRDRVRADSVWIRTAGEA
jgi:hypothetical protein